MKRPFLLVGAAAVLFAVIWGWTGGVQERTRLEHSETLLLETAEEQKLTLSGKVRTCSAASRGTKVSIDQISIIQNGSSIQSLEKHHSVSFTISETQNSGTNSNINSDGQTAPALLKAAPGDTVTVSGEIRTFEAATNPGQFDARDYYFGSKIICSLEKAEILAWKQGGGLEAFLCGVRRALRESMERILGEKEAGVAAAICLGEKAGMDGETKTVFQEGGIAHIAAISGLHVSLAGMGVYRLLRCCLAGIFPSCLGSGIITVLYVMMTGSSVSSIRACIMFLLWLLAQAAGRKYDMGTSIAVAAAVLLATQPEALTNSSFVLSFCAVIVIGSLVPRLTEDWKNVPLLGRLMPSLGIWLGMLPVVLWYFFQTSTWSFLLNLIVVPLMPLLVGMGLLSSGVGLLSVSAGTFLAAPVHYLIQCLEAMCRLELRLPGALFVAGRPGVVAVLLYYLILFTPVLAGKVCRICEGSSIKKVLRGRSGRRMGKRNETELHSRRRGRKERHGEVNSEKNVCFTGNGKKAVWVIICLFCLLLMKSRPPSGLEILCMDVGQGDGALLRFPTGEVCLVDGGSTSVSSLWKYRISQTLKYYGIDTVDYVFLSHGDEDHISAVEEYLEEYEPGMGGRNLHGITIRRIVLPVTADESDFAKIRSGAEKIGIPVYRVQAGSRIASGTAEGKDLLAAGSGAAEEKNLLAVGSGAADGKNLLAAGSGAGGEKKSWSLSVLAPRADQLLGDRNQDSMVLLLEYGGFRMLFTGDLEGEGEEHLLSCGWPLRADVLKVGHHGSNNGSNQPFLAQVSPKTAVISCGKNNRYGHPGEEALARLKETGCGIWCTMERGAVKIRVSGEKYRLSGYVSENR